MKFTMKNKKAIVVISIVAIMFIVGAVIGFTNFSKAKVAKIDENSFKNLIEAEYSVAMQDVKLDEDKGIAKVNIVSNMTKEQMIDLTKKIYQTTASAQEKLSEVEVYFFDKDYNEFPGFYVEGLNNKSIVNVEKNELKFFTYSTVPTVEKNVNATKNWVVNEIEDREGTAHISLALDNKSSGDAVIAQAKGLTELINSLNPDKEIKVAEYSINPDEANGFAYNTGYDTVLATIEKTSLK